MKKVNFIILFFLYFIEIISNNKDKKNKNLDIAKVYTKENNLSLRYSDISLLFYSNLTKGPREVLD